MFGKLTKVAMIVGGIIIVCLIIWAIFPVFQTMIGVASADPSAGNYIGYEEALGAAPLWLYGLPVVLGIILIVLVLRAPEER